MTFDKVYPVEEVGGVFLIKERFVSDLKPKFLAKNPNDGELFLLLGDHGSYSLLKGNVQKGMRFCKAGHVHLFGDCFTFQFEQDGIFGLITDPDFFPQEKPCYDPMMDGIGLITLDIIPFKITE